MVSCSLSKEGHLELVVLVVGDDIVQPLTGQENLVNRMLSDLNLPAPHLVVVSPLNKNRERGSALPCLFPSPPPPSVGCKTGCLCYTVGANIRALAHIQDAKARAILRGEGGGG
jgi:hypothetical protein